MAALPPADRAAIRLAGELSRIWNVPAEPLPPRPFRRSHHADAAYVSQPGRGGSCAIALPGFAGTGGMLSVSSLMGAATLMTASNDAKAAVEWAETFQKNHRLMTEESGGRRACGWRSATRPSTTRRCRSTPPARSPAC